MRFFFDTEFIEDGKTIEPLSIAIVSEEGDALYAVFTDTDRSLAKEWVQKNVIPYLDIHPEGADYWRGTKANIAEWIRNWIACRTNAPEFWADYAAYDWVLLCQLYGTMLDRPSNWPMFVRDIQQIRPAGMKLPEPLLAHSALSDAYNCRDRWVAITTGGNS